ncbi:MAG: NAD(P)-dependent oxidoreductase, partial [Rickettsiales bacterium]|nr:NAD(P)-dependent oxidoreductase [Rickettsiales bacterium]
CVINTASITAYQGQPVLMDYATTKGAVVGFTRALAGNLADKGVRVNAVAPGPIWTPLIPASFPAEKVVHFGESSKMGRPGQPDEVAPAYIYLACADSSYVTGQTIHINGGAIVGG